MGTGNVCAKGKGDGQSIAFRSRYAGAGRRYGRKAGSAGEGAMPAKRTRICNRRIVNKPWRPGRERTTRRSVVRRHETVQPAGTGRRYSMFR